MFIGLLLLGMLLIPLTASTQTIPTISIESIAPGSSVTIRTHNFPANQTFTVTMGKMWTAGIGGIVVGTINSGAGGSQSFSFNIPAELKGDAQISIRAQTGHANPWYAYNFFNNGGSSASNREIINAATPGYTGYPTFSIAAVKPRESVTIRTNNFPLNQTFTVTMGKMGTAGVNGIVVGNIDSTNWKPGQEYTFSIPAALKDDFQVSIRAQTAHTNPYYAYNFFTNNASGPGAREQNGGTTGVYVGIPTFEVTAVNPGKTVTIRTNNFPANQTFTVTMGPMYSQGVNGVVVGTLDSGDGSSKDYSYTIPAGLQGRAQIAIRAQTSHANPFYAYNWFYNNTANVCP
jgi:hypothetical protein